MGEVGEYWHQPSHNGNKYAVVFMDYFTKWLRPNRENYRPFAGRTCYSKTWSACMNSCYPIEEYTVTGAGWDQHIWMPPAMWWTGGKVQWNTHLPVGRDWDSHLPYVLFAYRVAVQESTQASLLYGREPRTPTESEIWQSSWWFEICGSLSCTRLRIRQPIRTRSIT